MILNKYKSLFLGLIFASGQSISGQFINISDIEFLKKAVITGAVTFTVIRALTAYNLYEVNKSLQQNKSKFKMFLPDQIKVNFDSVAGAEEAKEEIKDIVNFLKNPEKYNRLGGKLPHGVLLTGEPGNGKTLLAKAVAGEANCPFFSISGSDFVEVFVGTGAARVRELFSEARKHKAAIIFIDEIDSIGQKRSLSGINSGNSEQEQTLNQLLAEMDGFNSTDNIVVIGATNRVDILDKALLRPGRFDRHIEISYPNLESRFEILKIHSKDKKIDPNLDLFKIARGTPGFSGADLSNLINEATIIASKHNQDLVTIENFEEARDKILLGNPIHTKILSEDEKKITAFHEAGHALMILLNPKYCDPLHKVTIAPRSKALGLTSWIPEKDKYLSSRDELITSIIISLGGRAAEEVVFNEVSTGASSDFKMASDIAYAMVCDYGMSKNLGQVIYKHPYRGDHFYSENAVEKIDNEVRSIIDECYKKTIALLKANRDKLDKLSFALLEKGTMNADEIYQLLEITPRETHRLV